MVRQTSLDAYKELLDTGLLPESQERVYLALEELGEATDREIAAHLQLDDPNKVRPRRKELLDAGVVEAVEKGICSITHRSALKWRILDMDNYKPPIRRKIQVSFRDVLMSHVEWLDMKIIEVSSSPHYSPSEAEIVVTHLTDAKENILKSYNQEIGRTLGRYEGINRTIIVG